MTEQNQIKISLGTYRHYKGKLYEVIAVSRHSETLEELVLYRALYDSPEFGKDALWVRPRSMFFEKITVDGKEIPRFEHVPEKFWFKAKTYGYGWAPATWQGWATIILYVATVVSIFLFTKNILFLIPFTILLLAIAYLKGEPAKWRWGNREKE